MGFESATENLHGVSNQVKLKHSCQNQRVCARIVHIAASNRVNDYTVVKLSHLNLCNTAGKVQ